MFYHKEMLTAAASAYTFCFSFHVVESLVRDILNVNVVLQLCKKDSFFLRFLCTSSYCVLNSGEWCHFQDFKIILRLIIEFAFFLMRWFLTGVLQHPWVP